MFGLNELISNSVGNPSHYKPFNLKLDKAKEKVKLRNVHSVSYFLNHPDIDLYLFIYYEL